MTVDAVAAQRVQIDPNAMGKLPGKPSDSPKIEPPKAEEPAGPTIPERIAKIPEAFAAIGVSVEMIETMLGHTVGQLTENGLTELTNIYHAIKKGEAEITDIFAPAEITESEVRARLESLDTMGAITKAADEFIKNGADEESTLDIANEIMESMPGSGS